MPTLTLDFTEPHATRAAYAFGKVIGAMTEAVYDDDGVLVTPAEARPATMAEVRAHVRQYIVNVVKAVESREAESAAAASVVEIDPT